jgi:hypothetical protein
LAGAPKIVDLQAGPSFGAPHATIAILRRARTRLLPQCRTAVPMTGSFKGCCFGRMGWEIDETEDVDNVVSRAEEVVDFRALVERTEGVAKVAGWLGQRARASLRPTPFRAAAQGA